MFLSTLLPAAAAIISLVPAALALPSSYDSALGSKLASRGSKGTDYSITGFNVTIADGGNQGMLETFNFSIVGQTCTLVNIRERDQDFKQQIKLDCGSNQDLNLFMLLPQPLRAEVNHKQPDKSNRNINLAWLGGDGHVVGYVIDNVFNDDRISCTSGTAPLTCSLKSGQSIGYHDLNLKEGDDGSEDDIPDCARIDSAGYCMMRKMAKRAMVDFKAGRI